MVLVESVKEHDMGNKDGLRRFKSSKVLKYSLYVSFVSQRLNMGSDM